MNRSVNFCLNVLIAFLLVATVISWVVLSVRYNEQTIAIAEVTAEIETQRQVQAELKANAWLGFNEDDLERILQNAKPPCPLEANDSIVFFN